MTPRSGLDCEYINYGTCVLDMLASYAPVELIGTAFDADFILCNAEDALEEYYLEEHWFVAALEFAESHGAEVITVGAVDHQGNVAIRSSDGSTKDGGLKPEVLALGMDVSTISLFNLGYTTMGGVSSATPLMAGAIACILQTHPEWSGQVLRKALFHSGDFCRKHRKPGTLFIHGYDIPDAYSAASSLPVKKDNQEKTP